MRRPLNPGSRRPMKLTNSLLGALLLTLAIGWLGAALPALAPRVETTTPHGRGMAIRLPTRSRMRRSPSRRARFMTRERSWSGAG